MSGVNQAVLFTYLSLVGLQKNFVLICSICRQFSGKQNLDEGFVLLGEQTSQTLQKYVDEILWTNRPLLDSGRHSSELLVWLNTAAADFWPTQWRLKLFQSGRHVEGRRPKNPDAEGAEGVRCREGWPLLVRRALGLQITFWIFLISKYCFGFCGAKFDILVARKKL